MQAKREFSERKFSFESENLGEIFCSHNPLNQVVLAAHGCAVLAKREFSERKFSFESENLGEIFLPA